MPNVDYNWANSATGSQIINLVKNDQKLNNFGKFLETANVLNLFLINGLYKNKVF